MLACQMSRTLIFALLVCGLALRGQSNVQPQKSAKSKTGSAQVDQQAAWPLLDDAGISEADLRKAQRDEAEARTKYYRAQAEKIDDKPRPWERVIALTTPVGALVAAIVAFLSFGFNYRSTLRNQQDTQFYEALKRFGDKDSPAVRASAAGLLAELGTRSRFGRRNAMKPNLRLEPARGWKSSRPFLVTSLDQLTVGLLLEENPVVLGAITAAALKLIELHPWPWLRKLYNQNLDLQKGLVVALADFVAEETKDRGGEAQPEDWHSASAVCGYRPLIIETLAKRVGNHRQLGKAKFPHLLETSRLRLRKGVSDNAKISESLRLAAMRLRSNVGVLSEAIFRFGPQFAMDGVFLSDIDFLGTAKKLNMPESQLQDIVSYGGMPDSSLYQSEFQGANLYTTNLQGTALFSCGFEGASLRQVNLRSADLEFSRLIGTEIVDCNLDGALLYGAHIDETTVFYQTNWWAANFAKSNGVEVDNALLEKLYARILSLKNKYDTALMFGDETDPSKWLESAHPSVRKFVEEKQQKPALKN
jgi:hypothetical protein